MRLDANGIYLGMLHPQTRVGNNAQWADTNWLAETNLVYRNYYDLDVTNTTVATPNLGLTAPQPDLSLNILSLTSTGSRLMMAVIRNGFLWTCQHIGLDGTNDHYTATDEFGTNVNKSAIQWLALQINTSGRSLAYSDHGRIFDAATDDPSWYYFPSLMVNAAGDMLIGFSGSSTNHYITAFYSLRLANSSTSVPPVLLRRGSTAYPNAQFGDYSATLVEPADDRTFWTVQAFADEQQVVLPNPRPWATWIARIRPNP